MGVQGVAEALEQERSEIAALRKAVEALLASVAAALAAYQKSRAAQQKQQAAVSHVPNIHFLYFPSGFD